jgi:hypothetical protein
MKRLVPLLCAAALSGCVAVAKVETGEHVIGERMSVRIDGPWNRINAPGIGPAETWTMEGLPVDQLLLYPGIRDGDLMHAPVGSKQKEFRFRADMQPDEIVALFEGMFTRDGSRFQLRKLAPSGFGGLRGFRFEFDLVRRVDGVHLSGVGYGAVSRKEFFGLLYMAPRLAFFPRHVARVERIAQNAVVKE